MKSFEITGCQKEIEKIRHLSNMVRQKILESNPNYERKIHKFSNEELEDLDFVLCLAERVLLKYQHKQEAREILKEFVELIRNWGYSLNQLSEQIQEMLICAQNSIFEIKTAQSEVSSNLSLNNSKKEQNEGTINLTKSATPVYTHEYQQRHKPNCEQVV